MSLPTRRRLILSRPRPYQPPRLGDVCAWFSASGRKWQDSDKTTPSVADGDPVGALEDFAKPSRHAVQVTSGSRPVYKPSVWVGGPVIRFDGTDDWLVIDPDPLSSGGHSIFALVIVRVAVAAYDPVWVSGGTVNGQRIMLAGSSAPWGTYSGSDKLASTTLSLDTPYLLNMNYSGGSGRFFVNGSSDGSWSGEPHGNGSSVTYVGAEPAASRYSQIDVAEILLYKGLLTDSERLRVERFFRVRYGNYF